MRRRLAALVLVAAPIVLAAPARAATIEFGGGHGFAYAPAGVRIPPGGSVTWSGDFGFHPLHSAVAAEPYVNTAGSSFDHTFAGAGVYRFYCGMHGFSSGENQVGGMSGQVVVTNNAPPQAAFTQSATQVASGTRVTFDGSGSHDAEGPVTYAWDLDADGAFDDGTGPTADSVYTSRDNETRTVGVQLRVTDGNADAVGPEQSVVRHDLAVIGAAGAGNPPPGGGTPGAGTGSGVAPGGDVRAPRLQLLGRKLVVRAQRVGVRLSADEPGRATVTLRVKGQTLAKGSGAVGTTPRTVKLKLTAAGRKRLRHGSRVEATLTVVVRDAAGNRRTVRRPVTVRG
jgi:plastocyanin